MIYFSWFSRRFWSRQLWRSNLWSLSPIRYPILFRQDTFTVQMVHACSKYKLTVALLYPCASSVLRITHNLWWVTSTAESGKEFVFRMCAGTQKDTFWDKDMLKTSWRCLQFHICLSEKWGTPKTSRVPWLQSSISPWCNGHEMGLDFPLLKTSIVFCRSCHVPSYAHDIPAISCYIHISQSSIFAHCTSCFHISSYVRSPWFSWNGLEQKSLEQKRAVRSRFSHQVIKLKEVIKDKSGTVTKLKCSWAPSEDGQEDGAMDGHGWPEEWCDLQAPWCFSMILIY